MVVNEIVVITNKKLARMNNSTRFDRLFVCHKDLLLEEDSSSHYGDCCIHY
jgi:hypothetical protein